MHSPRSASIGATRCGPRAGSIASAGRKICRSLRVALIRRREPDFDLPPMPLGEHVIEDYRTLSLSLKAHPAGLLRRR